RLAQRGELMLPHDMSRKPVRIRSRAELGVREDVDLAMRLLERLHDLVALQPSAPPGDRVDIESDRMPQPDARRRSDPAEWIVRRIDERRAVPRTDGGVRAILEMPHEPPRELADDRMIQVALSPRGVREHAFRQQ